MYTEELLILHRDELTEVVAEVEGAVGGPGRVVGGGGVDLPVEEPPRAVADSVVRAKRRQRRRLVLGRAHRRVARRGVRARRGIACSRGGGESKDHYCEQHCRVGHGWHLEEFCDRLIAAASVVDSASLDAN